MAESLCTDYVAKIIAAAPDLKPEQRAALAELLTPVRHTRGERRHRGRDAA